MINVNEITLSDFTESGFSVTEAMGLMDTIKSYRMDGNTVTVWLGEMYTTTKDERYAKAEYAIIEYAAGY